MQRRVERGVRLGSIIFIIGVCLLLSCRNAQTDTSGPKGDNIGNMADGERMRHVLDSILAATDFHKHPYESEASLRLLEQQLRANQSNGGGIEDPFDYARQLLNAGKSAEATIILKQMMEAHPQLQSVNEQSVEIHRMLGISYLRMGEQENCLVNHNDETCVFPIRGAGVHRNTEGSSKAIQVYRDILAVFPDDLESKYLLNLAYQTLGKYPGEVPKAHFIDFSAMNEAKAFPRWTNIAIVGTSMVLAFVVMRAASFHHVDRLLSSALLGVRFNWVFEITGIGAGAPVKVMASGFEDLEMSIPDTMQLAGLVPEG